MPAASYDLITAGGGLGGAALARAMAQRGARVLVLERETKFKDRVRGEAMMPWGVAEARALGIADVLLNCGHELPWWDMYFGNVRTSHRDLTETTTVRQPVMAFYHPEMQEALLASAAEAGAEVRRGAIVRGVEPGMPAKVTVELDGRTEEIAARLVVAADGRQSMFRKGLGFQVRRDPDHLLISGLMFEDSRAKDDRAVIAMKFDEAKGALLFPQGGGRLRAYFVCETSLSLRLQGADDVARFIEESVLVGVDEDNFKGAKPAQPLATFDGADTWVEHPYRDGVALVGDAAAASDPSWGQGLSLTLRDVRVLRDRLLAGDDWDAAGHAYAAEHDRYFGVTHQVSGWMSELLFRSGKEADERRARALPLIAKDRTRLPDTNFSGPDVEVDDTTRRRLFGEE